MKLLSVPLLLLAGALAAPAGAGVYADLLGASRVDDDDPEKLKLGSKVPERLALPDFDGKTTSFKDLRGKVVVVHFWSDRCPAERHANPIFLRMEKAFAEREDEDVVMIGIAANQNELGPKPAEDADLSEHYQSLRKQRDEVGYEHAMLADHGNVVSSLFQARTTPHCFVIDRKGVLRYSGALDDDPRGKKGDEATNYVMDAVEAVLKDEKPTVEETKPYG